MMDDADISKKSPGLVLPVSSWLRGLWPIYEDLGSILGAVDRELELAPLLCFRDRARL